MNFSPPRLDSVICNGRSYRLPKQPTVVVCLDGSSRATSRPRSPRAARPSSTA